MSDTGAATRAAAASAVSAVTRQGRSLDAALAEAEQQVATTERSLLRLLAFGSLRHWWRLDERIARRLDRPLRARDQVVRALLVVGLYQLTETRIPPHAAVDLTVRAARRLRRPRLAGLVNAVLRAELRDPGGSRHGADADEGGPEPARYDHPQWLIDRLRIDWPGDWRDILAANNRRAPMWLRINAKRSDAASYAARLPNGARRLEALPQALALPEPLDVEELPGFRAGEVSVQDGAAQLAAPWLLAGGGLRIADLCAAPGGKTAHLLELSGPETTLTAVESDKERAARIPETLDRLGLAATLRVADASDL
ncbi:MAG: transcription antitermination factor NusB, partial [Woeseiaceae bacterium]|nr:transcription antitermination factor NusB [Woeseiaceae bacterium]